VLSHTCPISWEPTDLFLNCIDQSTVDKSTEVWMEKIKDIFKWQIWCFGHFHADRIERPHVEMFFNDIEELDAVWLRWHKYRTDGELDWWLDKSPNFYMY
jgi:3-oxoacid CoA-transferase subunit A